MTMMIKIMMMIMRVIYGYDDDDTITSMYYITGRFNTLLVVTRHSRNTWIR